MVFLLAKVSFFHPCLCVGSFFFVGGSDPCWLYAAFGPTLLLWELDGVASLTAPKCRSRYLGSCPRSIRVGELRGQEAAAWLPSAHGPLAIAQNARHAWGMVGASTLGPFRGPWIASSGGQVHDVFQVLKI